MLAGYYRPADVVKWADFVIARYEKPDDAIIEVSLAACKKPEDIADKLNEVDGYCDEEMPLKIILGLLYKDIKRDHNLVNKVARMLYNLAIHEITDDNDAYDMMIGFDDEVDLAIKKIYGNLNEITMRIEDFLRQYEDYVEYFHFE